MQRIIIDPVRVRSDPSSSNPFNSRPSSSSTTHSSSNPLSNVVESQKNKILTLHSSLEAARARNELLQSKFDVFSRSQDALEEKLRVAQAATAAAKEEVRTWTELYRDARREGKEAERKVEDSAASISRLDHSLRLEVQRRLAFESANAEFLRVNRLLVEENGRICKADERVRRPFLAQLELSHRAETHLLHQEITNLRERLLLFSSDPSSPSQNPSRPNLTANDATTRTSSASCSSSSSKRNVVDATPSQPGSIVTTGGLPSPAEGEGAMKEKEMDSEATLHEVVDGGSLSTSSSSKQKEKQRGTASPLIDPRFQETSMTDFQRSIQWLLTTLLWSPTSKTHLYPIYNHYVLSSGPPHPSAFSLGPEPLTVSRSLFPPHLQDSQRMPYFQEAMQVAFPGVMFGVFTDGHLGVRGVEMRGSGREEVGSEAAGAGGKRVGKSDEREEGGKKKVKVA